MNILQNINGKNPYGLTDNYGYDLTVEETKEYFQSMNMTTEELEYVNDNIKEGWLFNDIRTLIYYEDGSPMNILDAYRTCKDMIELHENGTIPKITSKVKSTKFNILEDDIYF